MTKPETLLDYGRRVARVADHIAGHLDDELDVERLAGVAHFSPWHFHRIYRETTGETVADTVRRLRLHRAAVELTRDDDPLERVAKRAGYGTLAAFSRAFAADYGIPPGAYRLRGRLVPPSPARSQEPVKMYDVEIAPFEAVRLAAIAHRGDYHEINRAFEQAMVWAASRGLLEPATRSIGIYYDDPLTIPMKDLRSEAGLVVGDGVKLDGDVHEIRIPSMRCASVIHKGPYAELETPYRYLFREWLPQSGHEAGDHPCFEEYLNNPRDLPPSEWLTRISLPLKD
jgi:AraC family transcriptional regulator